MSKNREITIGTTKISKVYFGNGDLHYVEQADLEDPDFKYRYREYSSGRQEWLLNGKRHREDDLPAVILENGTKEWWKDGRLCRDNDKPSVILADGTRRWYKNGVLHRDGDKPAVIYAGGNRQWWKNGKQLEQPEHTKKKKEKKKVSQDMLDFIFS
jgi:hypothetical protein